MMAQGNYQIDSDRLEAIVNAYAEYEPGVATAEATLLYDWPEGQGHRDWLDNAPAQEVADWLAASIFTDYDQIIHDEIAANGTNSRFMGHGLDPETGAYDAEECRAAILRHEV
jgi:hypothetical protein